MKSNTLPNELVKNINKCVRHIRNDIAKQIALDLKKEYRTVIEKFYSHYHPRSYARTYETLLANNLYRNGGDYKKITVLRDNSCTVKFQVGSEFIDGGTYRADAGWVYGRTFEEGIHGWIPYTVKNIISKRVDVNKAGWMMNVTQPAQPLSPSPKSIMDTWFKKYKTSANLSKICKPITKANMSKFL